MRHHVLVFNSPFAGHVTPSLGVVTELAERGHRVTYVTKGRFSAAIEATGARALPYGSAWPVSLTVSEKDAAVGLSALLRESVAGARRAKAAFGGDRPDLVLYDGTAIFAGRVLSRGWHLPGVEMIPSFASNQHFSLNDEIARKAVGRGTAQQLDPSAMARFGEEMAEFLDENGLSGAAPEDLFHTPEELSLAFLPKEFQYAGETFDDRRTVFVGPCLTDRAHQGGWQPPGDDPVLLVSFGSGNYGGQPEFLKTCVRAFAGLRWHVVITTGTELDPAELGPLPANVEAFRQVPQLAILRRAGAFISHGGMGGTMEALAQGIPVLTVPQMPEQELVADRIAQLGAGRRITLDIDAGELRSRLLELSGDGAMAGRAKQVRRAIEQAGGAKRAVDEIESYLLRGRTAQAG